MKECLADHHVLSQRILSIRVTHPVSPYPHWYVFTIQHLHRQPGPWPPSRIGILPCRFGSPFVPVGAGEGLCGVGTLASPWLEGESVHRGTTNVTICPPKSLPLKAPLPPLQVRLHFPS